MTHRAALLFAWVLPAVDPKQGLACNGPSGRSRECQKDDRELNLDHPRSGVWVCQLLAVIACGLFGWGIKSLARLACSL